MAALESAGWLRDTQRRTFEWAAKLLDKAGMLCLPTSTELAASLDVATPLNPAMRRAGLEAALARVPMDQFTPATQQQLKWALGTVYKVSGRAGLRDFIADYPLPPAQYFQGTGMSADNARATAQFVEWWERSGRDAYLQAMSHPTTNAEIPCQSAEEAVT